MVMIYRDKIGDRSSQCGDDIYANMAMKCGIDATNMLMIYKGKD
jgi:hypothetical protein